MYELNVHKAVKENNDIEGIIHFPAFKSVLESVEFPLSYFRNNNDSLNNVLFLVDK